MRLPCITIRRLMVAVAIAGMTLDGTAWCLKLYRLHRQYIAKSNYYELRYDSSPASPTHVREWEGQMMMKYRNHAFCPWLPVEPDPPEPE
jgi:hypothetical protein